MRKKTLKILLVSLQIFFNTTLSVGNPLQCSRLGNPMDRGAWQAAVHRVTKSWTWLSDYHSHNLYQMSSPDT